MDWNGLMDYEYGMIKSDYIRRCPMLEDGYRELLGLWLWICLDAIRVWSGSPLFCSVCPLVAIPNEMLAGHYICGYVTSDPGVKHL